MDKILSFLFGTRVKKAPSSSHSGRDSCVAAALETDSALEIAEWSRHYDGYVREAALIRAVELRSPELLAAIVERLNDWVPQVRHAARNALLTLVPLLPADAVLHTLPAIDRLRHATREDHSAWIRRYELAIIEQLGAELIIDEAQGGMAELARPCFRMVEEHALLPLDRLAELVLKAGQDFGTSLAASRIARLLGPGRRNDLAELGFRSRFGAVRTAALRELLSSPDPERDILAEQALLDPQSSVREVAMWYLKQRGTPADRIYAATLMEGQTAPRTARICLASLATCGNPEHIPLIKRYAKVRHARTQANAVLAWVRLDPEARDEIVMFALKSEVPRVRKLALVLLSEFGAFIDLDEAIRLANDKSDHVLALALARKAPWTWLATILDLSARYGAAAPMQEQLAAELHQWNSESFRIFLAPTTNQVRTLTSGSARATLSSMFANNPAGLESLQRTLAIHGLA